MRRAGADFSGFSTVTLAGAYRSSDRRSSRQLPHCVEESPCPAGLALERLAGTNQIPSITGAELDHSGRARFLVRGAQDALRSLAIGRIRRKIDAEERSLVLAAAGVGGRHPA